MAPTPPAHHPESTRWLLLLVSWLIPGAGFFILGRRTRGGALFATVFTTFFIGIMLHGGVVWPSWTTKSEDFNLINNFTFLVQMGAGLPALASLLASLNVSTGEGSGLFGFLAGYAPHPFFELGSYYLIVAGAINYFAIGNYFDRLVRLHPRFADQENGPTEHHPS